MLDLPTKPSPWRRAARWGGLLAVVALAAGGWQVYQAKTAKPAAEKYVTQPADYGDVVAKITASGTISARKTVDVGSQISGRVAQVLVDFNARVRKGQVLARIDPQLLLATRQQAQASWQAAHAALVRAQAQAENAGRQARRMRTLAAQGFIAAADVDTAATNAEVARTQVESARATLAQADAARRQAEVNLTYAVITSPIDGVVISRNVNVGQTVAASLQAPTLFVLAEDLRHLEVHASVAESDVGRLSTKMPATFTVDAFPGEAFDAEVRQIRNAAQTVQNVVTYDAVLDAQNPDGKLRMGMNAQVSFIEAEAEDVLRVPNAALRFRPAGQGPAGGRWRRGEGEGGSPAPGASPAVDAGPSPGASPAPAVAPAAGASPDAAASGEGGRRRGKRVYVLAGEELRPVRVKTGLTDGTVTEITEVVDGTLNEGDLVVTDEQGAAPNGGGRSGGARSGGSRNRIRGLF